MAPSPLKSKKLRKFESPVDDPKAPEEAEIEAIDVLVAIDVAKVPE